MRGYHGRMSDLSFLGFETLLELVLERPEAEQEIQRRYVTHGAVLIVDFTSMVRHTDRLGIVHALALARAAERALTPALAVQEGTVVKRVADTLFVVFPTARQALTAALDAQRLIDTFSASRGAHAHAHDPVRGCMGLGCGEVLLIPNVDMYGPEVNRAFVLGEDVANGGEVLVTENFLAALDGLPPGVGAHRAPADREDEAHFSFHVVGDFR